MMELGLTRMSGMTALRDIASFGAASPPHDDRAADSAAAASYARTVPSSPPVPFCPVVSAPLWQLGMSTMEAARIPAPVVNVDPGAMLPVPARLALGIRFLSFAGLSEQGVLSLYR